MDRYAKEILPVKLLPGRSAAAELAVVEVVFGPLGRELEAVAIPPRKIWICRMYTVYTRS